ncbi:MAG: hypothetical protein ACK5ZC_08255 [Pirellulaceae bacterium]|jgi:hypothetical protein
MIDELPHCESRYEAISLLAAGYLSSVEEHDLRLHLAKCIGCLKRLEQSTAVCLGLRSVPLSSNNVEASEIVSRVMAEISATNAGAAQWDDRELGVQFLAFFGLEAVLTHVKEERSGQESLHAKDSSSSHRCNAQLEAGASLLKFFGLPIAS